jgi:hypothetical protein
MEIGTNAGESLKAARCSSIAVDPAFALGTDVTSGKEACHLYRMPSDRFFARFNPTDILGMPIDMAFIDGMHLYEFVVRDISNVEKHCKRNSIIAIHDCIPTDVYVAERVDDYDRRKKVSTRPDWWTGDVWKIIPLLKSYRPDLCMYAVDSFPTGLLLLTNLDPTSAVLSDKYFDICREFQQLSLMEYGLERFISELGLVSTSEFENLQSFAKRFWL